jgi:hypothetical protein
VFQFGHPVSDIIAVGVTFLGLGDGVEYSLGGQCLSSKGKKRGKGLEGERGSEWVRGIKGGARERKQSGAEEGSGWRREETYEIRLRIRSGTSSPLPSTIIGSQVPIDKALHKVFLSQSYSSAQYLDQATRDSRQSSIRSLTRKQAATILTLFSIHPLTLQALIAASTIG